MTTLTEQFLEAGSPDFVSWATAEIVRRARAMGLIFSPADDWCILSASGWTMVMLAEYEIDEYDAVAQQFARHRYPTMIGRLQPAIVSPPASSLRFERDESAAYLRFAVPVPTWHIEVYKPELIILQRPDGTLQGVIYDDSK